MVVVGIGVFPTDQIRNSSIPATIPRIPGAPTPRGAVPQVRRAHLPQHFLNFFPELHGHGAFLPTFTSEPPLAFMGSAKCDCC